MIRNENGAAKARGIVLALKMDDHVSGNRHGPALPGNNREKREEKPRSDAFELGLSSTFALSWPANHANDRETATFFQTTLCYFNLLITGQRTHLRK